MSQRKMCEVSWNYFKKGSIGFIFQTLLGKAIAEKVEYLAKPCNIQIEGSDQYNTI